MARITEPRVRETSETEGTNDIVLAGAMYGSLAFSQVMVAGDTADIVISYGNMFEDCRVSMNASGHLVRVSTRRSLHANGSVNTSPVSFPPGIKTVIMSVSGVRLSALEDYSLRMDFAQTFNNSQKAQGQSNLGLFPAGTRMLFHQTTPPTGWSKDTGINDKTLRVTSSTVGSGGSVAFSTLFGRTSTDSVTLTASNIPSLSASVSIPGGQSPHGHPIFYNAGAAGGSDNFYMQSPNPDGLSGGASTGPTPLSALTGTATYSNGASSFAMGIDMRIAYVDIIIAQKDW